MFSGQAQSFMGYIYQAFSILKELIVIIIIFFWDDIYKLENNYFYNIDTYFLTYLFTEII